MVSNARFRESDPTKNARLANAKATKAVKAKATNAVKQKQPNTTNKRKENGTSKGKAKGRGQGCKEKETSKDKAKGRGQGNKEQGISKGKAKGRGQGSKEQGTLTATSDDARGSFVVRCGRCDWAFYEGDPELECTNFRHQDGYGDCCPPCSMALGNFTSA